MSSSKRHPAHDWSGFHSPWTRTAQWTGYSSLHLETPSLPGSATHLATTRSRASFPQLRSTFHLAISVSTACRSGHSPNAAAASKRRSSSSDVRNRATNGIEPCGSIPSSERKHCPMTAGSCRRPALSRAASRWRPGRAIARWRALRQCGRAFPDRPEYRSDEEGWFREAGTIDQRQRAGAAQSVYRIDANVLCRARCRGDKPPDLRDPDLSML